MFSNRFDSLYQTYLNAIEDSLRQAVSRANTFGNSTLHDMLAYHMGWKASGKGSEVRGKRIRPLLLLLSCSAAGGDWSRALPGATAVELVHNFSLIHDDIEDHSPLRRGRKTVWKKWGIPQAINAGDAMFALAHLEAIRLAETVDVSICLKAVEILQYTCFHLTQGQYLDLSYESRKDLTVDDYWPMVEGKTAALISASTQLGALAASGDDHMSEIYRQFGRMIGLAFQVQDDLLGIWGNASITGKSIHSDLVTGKITLPVLYGLSQGGEFASRWRQGQIHPEEVPQITHLLELSGAKEFAHTQVTRLLDEAIATFKQAQPMGLAAEALVNLASSLVNRQS
jgi:geranylgeranyl diphosphate synthase type I